MPERGEAAPFPWGAVMRFGLARLRLPPEQFWRLTPRELAAMAGFGGTATGAIGRAELGRLMADYPDEERR
jgi:uncharacterized phage protein (TIGR02216 family)